MTMNPKQQKCPACGGLGYKRHTPGMLTQNCTLCGGAGFVEYEFPHFVYDTTQTEPIPGEPLPVWERFFRWLFRLRK